MFEPNDLVQRTRQFSLASLRFYKRLPKNPDAQVSGIQFLKASSSVAANYRAAKRGRSKAEFIAKLGTVVEESDECVYWLEYMRDGNIASDPELLSEAYQLRKIFGKSLGTARRNSRHRSPVP